MIGLCALWWNDITYRVYGSQLDRIPQLDGCYAAVYCELWEGSLSNVHVYT